MTTRKQQTLSLFAEPEQATVSQYHLDKWAAESAARRARREALEEKWAAQEAAYEAAPPVEEQPRPFAPGDKLILNGSDPSGWSARMPRRPWVVVECACEMCASGSHVALDVPESPAMLELYPDISPWRHVGAGALRRKGELSRKTAEAWGDVLAMGAGVGQALSWMQEDGRDGVVRVFTGEFASLALADALGSTELTESQADQLEQWRAQRGGKELP